MWLVHQWYQFYLCLWSLKFWLCVWWEAADGNSTSYSTTFWWKTESCDCCTFLPVTVVLCPAQSFQREQRYRAQTDKRRRKWFRFLFLQKQKKQQPELRFPPCLNYVRVGGGCFWEGSPESGLHPVFADCWDSLYLPPQSSFLLPPLTSASSPPPPWLREERARLWRHSRLP